MFMWDSRPRLSGRAQLELLLPHAGKSDSTYSLQLKTLVGKHEYASR
jgi:hypothetical protein